MPTSTSIGRILHTGGEALGRLRLFLMEWWQSANLRAMLAPVETPDNRAVYPQVITEPEHLQRVNPFAPVMPVNTASLIDEFLETHLQGKLAVILRPCELRTWVEMSKRREAIHPGDETVSKPDRLAIISIDCTGTYDPVTFAERVAREGIPALVQEVFQQTAGEIPASTHMRPACRCCDRPYPLGADLGILLLGQATNEQMVLVANQLFEKHITASPTTAGSVPDKFWERRATVLDQVKTRLDSRFSGANGFTSPHGLLSAFARCSMCTDCLDACPLYDGELASMLGIPGSTSTPAPLLVNLVGISRWLASCSGCGVCQAACSQEIPLLEIVLQMNRQICRELSYQPGDPGQKLPWI